MTTPHFVLLLLPEVTLLPYAGFTDKLRFSADDDDRSRQRYCTWHSCKLLDEPLYASSGACIDIPVLTPDLDLSQADFVVLFGGRTSESALTVAPKLLPVLQPLIHRNTHVVAIDNAVFTLAACGFLTGKRAMLHWRHQTQLKQLFPKVQVQEQGLFVTDGNITTACGGTGAIELAEYLLAHTMNPMQASKGLADMMVSERRNPLEFTPWQQQSSVTDRHVYRALILLSEGLGHSLDMELVSRRIGISRRQLDRKFLQQFQLTASAYFQKMRLERAAWLLHHSTGTLEQVANTVGYQNLGHFRSQFKRCFGHSPRAYRENQ
ncbi:helix-turn-helix domain-containing protein [Maribrevibacterium harenarium]|uniref:Helix-turn-helix domain-containing protein n=1 Tax=Maribrevibacterium harenarium TaxID=2589817 RepID=A0A501X4F1_9GAMM|nr:helix-turn-helix domain-containing protein [Maribrevibacterium harenarium]TPE55319.1 helix-turn-helix domain-containing protein [Maribrevibacterium harenarium]